MGPRAIRGVANLAPNTKLSEVQQDANAVQQTHSNTQPFKILSFTSSICKKRTG